MKILLVNNNQVVQKLIDVTTRKVDCELTTLISFQEFKSENDVKKYDLVVFDQEILEGYRGDFSFLEGLKSIILYSQASEDEALLSHFTYTIKKPFLPNEFLGFLVSAKQNLKEKQKEEFANLDEKEMFANIDAEDRDEDSDDDDLNQLLKDLNISVDHSDSLENEESRGDDLDALLQELPEEDGFLEEDKQEDKQEEALQESELEGENEIQEVENSQEIDQEIEELDGITESDIEPQEDSQKIEVLEVETPIMPQEQEEKNQDLQESKEDEHDELSKILDESDEEIEENAEEEHGIGGALDLAEIAKVQGLLNEVQKSGGKVAKETFGELDLLQNLLSSRSPEGIREILDGMQLTINISFPKKEN